MKMIDLSVVIPAYNEERNIGGTIKKIWTYLELKGYSFEIIVVDDGSDDRTGEIVRSFKGHGGNIFLIENERNFGKGYSVKRGMLAARGEAVLFTDADLSISIEHLERMMPLLQKGFSILAASRYVQGSKMVYPKKVREKMGRVFNKLVNAIFHLNMKDTQCGFKLFSREAAKRLFERCSVKGFAFDVEVLVLARVYKYKTLEVPVKCINSPRTSVKIIRSPLNMLISLMLIKLKEIWGW